MATSIAPLTPEHHENRGAMAFHDGLGEHDHELPENSLARKHWQFGWHTARVEQEQLAGSAPP